MISKKSRSNISVLGDSIQTIFTKLYTHVSDQYILSVAVPPQLPELIRDGALNLNTSMTEFTRLMSHV